MGAIRVLRASRTAQHVWCARSAASRTRRGKAPTSNSSRNLRARTQGVETVSVGCHRRPARQRFDMADDPCAFARIEEKEGAASLSVISPHLGRAVLSHEARLAIGGLHSGGGK